jgi:hypothetical protein
MAVKGGAIAATWALMFRRHVGSSQREAEGADAAWAQGRASSLFTPHGAPSRVGLVRYRT